MDMGQVFHVADPCFERDVQHTAKVLRGYAKGCVNSGCTQSVVHQTLIWPGALADAEWVEVMCLYVNIYKYSIVLLNLEPT